MIPIKPNPFQQRPASTCGILWMDDIGWWPCRRGVRAHLFDGCAARGWQGPTLRGCVAGDVLGGVSCRGAAAAGEAWDLFGEEWEIWPHDLGVGGCWGNFWDSAQIFRGCIAGCSWMTKSLWECATTICFHRITQLRCSHQGTSCHTATLTWADLTWEPVPMAP